jgi:hypothetical protein
VTTKKLRPALREAPDALPRHGRKVFRFLDRRGRVLGAGAVSQKAGGRLSMKSLRKGFGYRHAGKVPATSTSTTP